MRMVSRVADNIIFMFYFKVIVSAKEEPDRFTAPAMNGLLRVHKHIIDADDGVIQATPGVKGRVVTRILVPAAQGLSLIGKEGSILNSIRSDSRCIVRVSRAAASQILDRLFLTRKP